MSWARIMAPLSGGSGDAAAVAAAIMLAEPFEAEMAGVYTPADVADVMPWMGEGFLGGVQTAALDSLKEAAEAGEKNARAAMDATTYARSRFIALQTPVWAGLSAESRLSDVVVFTSDPARGRGPLAEAFQQMVADEQRPVLIAREGLRVGGTVGGLGWWQGGFARRAAGAAPAGKIRQGGDPGRAEGQFAKFRPRPPEILLCRARRGRRSGSVARCRRCRPGAALCGAQGRSGYSGGRRLRPSAPAGIHLRRNDADAAEF